ncbi:hypothetical protein [Nostoc sp.]
MSISAIALCRKTFWFTVYGASTRATLHGTTLYHQELSAVTS